MIEYDVGDEVQVEKRKTRRQIELEREQEDLRKILLTYYGRAFIWSILERAGMERLYKPAPIEVMAFQAGERAVGQSIKDEVLAVDPNIWTQMRNEANDRLRERKNA